MTLLHITTSAQRAWLATDTTTYLSDAGEPGADVLYHRDGAPVSVAKLHPLPHLRCVLASRGTGLIARRALWAIEDAGARDFEHAAQLLAHHLPAMPPIGGTYLGKPLRQEVHLIGWSGEGCMALASFCSEDGYRPSIKHCAAGGGTGSYGPMPRPAWLHEPGREAETLAFLVDDMENAPRCIESVAAYARKAVRIAREEDPRAPYGGRLVVAELTKDSIMIRDFGDMGLPPRRKGARDLLGAVLLSGALAGCGGADNIAADAVAKVLYGTDTSTTTDVGAGLTYTVITLAAFTPATPAVVSSFATFDADTAAGSDWTSSYGHYIQVEQPGGIGTVIGEIRTIPPARATQGVEFTTAVSAGHAVTVKLIFTAPPGVTSHSYNKRLQAEFIMR